MPDQTELPNEFNRAGNFIRQAVQFLAPLDDARLGDTLWACLSGRPPAEMPSARGQEPVDTFVDLISIAPEAELSCRVKALTAGLLGQSLSQPLKPNAPALFELCYLSARTGIAEAIGPLTDIASRPEADTLSSNGESLRLRALRCLVGLLGQSPERAEPRHRTLLEAGLAVPACETICLTGLVGLWPEAKEEFLARAKNVDARQLDLCLSLGGFRAKP